MRRTPFHQYRGDLGMEVDLSVELEVVRILAELAAQELAVGLS